MHHTFLVVLSSSYRGPMAAARIAGDGPLAFSAENFPSSSPFRRAAFSDTRYTSVATFFYFNGS